MTRIRSALRYLETDPRLDAADDLLPLAREAINIHAREGV